MPSTKRHVPFAQLVDLVEGRASDDEQKRARAHTSSCGRCAAELVWLEQVIDLMRTDETVDAPPEAIARAVGLFHSRKAPDRASIRQLLRAILRFDSTRASLAPALRSRVPLERQLIFEAEGFNLDLRVRPDGPMWLIFGQVFGAAGRGLVQLNGPTGTTQADLNDLSEFRLPLVPAGSYNLTLRLESVDVEIAGLEIGV
jgi:hypothetical protein